MLPDDVENVTRNNLSDICHKMKFSFICNNSELVEYVYDNRSRWSIIQSFVFCSVMCITVLCSTKFIVVLCYHHEGVIWKEVLDVPVDHPCFIVIIQKTKSLSLSLCFINLTWTFCFQFLFQIHFKKLTDHKKTLRQYRSWSRKKYSKPLQFKFFEL